jgi:predicted metal-dependent HD superfamily phosphohydrolase
MLESTFNRGLLWTYWKTAHAQLGVALGDRGQDEFNTILAAYKAKGRKYHGIKHLVHGLDMIRQIQRSLLDLGTSFARIGPSVDMQPQTGLTFREMALLVLAFFYHDIIYDVSRKDNEVMSAKRAREYLSAFLREDELLRIDVLIHATADHQNSDVTDPLWPLMNDGDLAIMAAKRPIYEQYGKKVWQEYRAIVKRLPFVTGRADFIKKFGSKPIFRTEFMMGRKEEIAKENLFWEYARLVKEADELMAAHANGAP